MNLSDQDEPSSASNVPMTDQRMGLLGIFIKPFPGFSSQVTSPDHFTQQGTGPIFGVPQFFVKIVLNHQEGV
jgi:hypothetical protein